MAKIKVNDVDRFKTGEGNEFFALKKDKESAVVRFLYEDEDDLDLYAVHEVIIGGKKRWVSCLDNGHCPLCKSGTKVQIKLFLQMDVDGEVKTWERGKTFLPKILGYFDKFGPLINRDYEIVRHGKPNSTETTYELYPMDKEDITLEEYLDETELEKQKFEGSFILDWDEDEMEEYLDGGIPRQGSSGDDEEEETPRRRGRERNRREEREPEKSRGTSRRRRKPEPEEEEEDEDEEDVKPPARKRKRKEAEDEKPEKETKPRGRKSKEKDEDSEKETKPRGRKAKQGSGEEVF